MVGAGGSRVARSLPPHGHLTGGAVERLRHDDRSGGRGTGSRTPAVRPSAGPVDVLQRLVGNRAVAQLLGEPGCPVGERSGSVRTIQHALVDDGIPLPRSTRPDGTLDGVFGAETKEAVREFQRRLRLDPDGAVGKDTMAALDARYASP